MRNRITLSERLAMSADMVSPGSIVADIGCDHAHTDIYLMSKGVCKRCIAMDVRKGPLQKAAENLALYGYTDRIELRLSDGCEKLKPNEADTVIIAGMGGLLTTGIITRAADRGIIPAVGGTAGKEGSTVRKLILQPQSHIDEVRRALSKMGYEIENEEMCKEDGKFYTTIKAAYKGEITEYDEPEMYFGPILLKRRSSIAKEYIELEHRKAQNMLNAISKSTTPEAMAKHAEVSRLFDTIDEALRRMI